MKTFKQYIQETPDSIRVNGKQIAHHTHRDAYTFGIIDNILFYSQSSTHLNIGNQIEPRDEEDFYEFFSPENKEYFEDEHEGVSYVILGQLQYNAEVWQNLPVYIDRLEFHVAGRVWTESKLMSFWNPFVKVKPSLPLIIKFMEELHLNPTEFRYEFIDMNDLYQWSDLGVDEPSSGDMKSQEEIAQDQAIQHIKSPLLKRKKLNPPEMIRRGKLIPKAGVQLSPGGKPILGDSVKGFKKYIVESTIPETINKSMIGRGLGRYVYKSSKDGIPTVIKVAYNESGIKQNINELKISRNPEYQDIITPLIDYDRTSDKPKWVEFAFADTFDKSEFKSYTGYAFELFARYLPYYYKLNQNQQLPITELQERKIKNDEFFKRIVSFINSENLKPGEFVFVENWGILNGIPVIIDFGAVA